MQFQASASVIDMNCSFVWSRTFSRLSLSYIEEFEYQVQHRKEPEKFIIDTLSNEKITPCPTAIEDFSSVSWRTSPILT